MDKLPPPSPQNRFVQLAVKSALAQWKVISVELSSDDLKSFADPLESIPNRQDITLEELRRLCGANGVEMETERAIQLQGNHARTLNLNPLDFVVPKFVFSGNGEQLVGELTALVAGSGARPWVLDANDGIKRLGSYDIDLPEPTSIRSIFHYLSEEYALSWTAIVTPPEAAPSGKAQLILQFFKRHD